MTYLIAQASNCPANDLTCRSNAIQPSTPTPSPYPNYSVDQSGIVATLPDYMGSSFYSKIQEGFTQSILLTFVVLGIILTIQFLKSLKK